MKKVLLIILGVVILIMTLPVIFLKLAFGPIHESGTIDLEQGVELLFEETYNGDFSQAFYDVEIILKTASGKRYPLGSTTFHQQDWSKKIKTMHVTDWLGVTFEEENSVKVKIINTVSGELNDISLLPFELCRDSSYVQKYHQCPDTFYQGSCQLLDCSGNTLDVDYEYKIQAAYPSEILVTQKTTYEIDPLHGTLRTKYLHEQLPQ